MGVWSRIINVHGIEPKLPVIQKLDLSQFLFKPLVNVGVVRKDDGRDRLRDQLLANVEQRLRLPHAGQADNHEMWIRSTRDVPSHFRFAEFVGAQNDLGDFSGTLSLRRLRGLRQRM